MTGLIVASLVVGGAFAFWGVMRLEERYDPRHDTAPIPVIVPGRETPAARSAPPHPPAVAGGEVLDATPAGGSNVPAAGMVAGEIPARPCSLSTVAHETPAAGTPSPPAGDTLAPGPGCLPEGDAPGSRPPQEAPGREPATLSDPYHPPGSCDACTEPPDFTLYPDWPTGDFAAVIDALGDPS